jgi:hypothetical protein
LDSHGKGTAMTGQRDLGKVLYETDGAIARVILNWPEKANSQSSDLVWQVDEALDLAQHDATIKVVIFKANGKGFCAGHDMSGGPDAYPEFARSTATASVAGRTGRTCLTSRSPPTTHTSRCRWCRVSGSLEERRWSNPGRS